MAPQNLTDELRRGSLCAGERLPTPEQCAGQRADYERFEREELHVSHAVDAVMAMVQRRVERRRVERNKERQLLLPLVVCGRRMQAAAALMRPFVRKESTDGTAELAEVSRAGESLAGDSADSHV